jgi:hypothetical protein
MYMNGGGDGVDNRRDRVSILIIVMYGEMSDFEFASLDSCLNA